MSSAHGIIVCAVCVAALLVGCRSAPVEGAWSKATEDMLVQQQLQRIVRCPFLSGGSALHVMVIGAIENDTTLVGNDNIEYMKSEIASGLTNSGLVMITTCGTVEGRDSLPQGGNAIVPTLMLHGKLVQRDSRRKDGSLQHEFTLDLSMIEISTGHRIWNFKNMVGVLDDVK